MKYFLCLFFLLANNYTYAQLAVDQIIVDFASDQVPRSDINLFNTSTTETLYINVEVIEVKQPGEENELRTVAQNPMEVGLLASPDMLILPPESQQAVRLVNLLPVAEQDRIYRVDISPVAGGLEASESAVKMMVGYEALVIIRPDTPEVNVKSERIGNTLRLTNKGNTNVFVDRIQYCDSDDEESCEFITGNRLYAGNVWELELSGDGEVSLDLFDGQRTTTRNL